jgi:lipid A 3-O-deacylase
MRLIPVLALLASCAFCRASFALESPPLSLDPTDIANTRGRDRVLTPDVDQPLVLFSQFRSTFYWENDGNWAKPFDEHDRHYTAGVGMSFSWRAPWVDDLLKDIPSFGDQFAEKTDFAMGFVGAVTIYTPENITTTEPQFNDRPFAGFSWGGLFFQRARRTPPPESGFPQLASIGDLNSYSAFESFEIDLGMMGPSSLGQNAQEMIHHSIGDPVPVGWVNQIHDEPEFSLKYNRRWRSQLGRIVDDWPITVQVLPDVGVTAGSILDEVRLGLGLRVGYNMPDDFGPGELKNPADFTYQAACPCPDMFDKPLENQSLYFFIRPGGRFVAHNALLHGDNWRHDDIVTVTPEPAIFEVQFGLGWQILKHFEVVYVCTYESAEFVHQKGWDGWSSVQFTWSVAF